MASKRELMAVYQDKDGNWVATVKQGCIIERHTLIKRGTNPYQQAELGDEARERALKLV